MAAAEKWYFTKEQLANTPSRKFGYDADKELSCRQQAANFIQDMGQRLQVTQLCINTAIVYMHRFYMFHSFSRFHRNSIAAAALFLAAKVEEQPRKLEHVIKVAQICLHREHPPQDLLKSEFYMEQAQELVVNENILLQTLGFDVAIDHPHTHVVRCCTLVRAASTDLAKTSYFMASNSLHLTTMCLQYKPTVVACFCIHLACKWSDWEVNETFLNWMARLRSQIPQSTEGKPWFYYIDRSVTQELLEQLTDEFLVIFEKCPSRFKKKIMSLSPNQLAPFSKEAVMDKKRNGEGLNQGSNLSSSSATSGEDIKKKQEYQRHHADYKKHHMPHHSRPDQHGSMPMKQACMFGPPQRTQPPVHSSNSSSSSNQHSRSVSKPNAVQQAEVLGLGKPEHLHHRPRRPEEKHPRNHEQIPPPYKKYDKVSSGVSSDYQSNVGRTGVGISGYGSGYQPPPPTNLSDPVTVKTESSHSKVQQVASQPQINAVPSHQVPVHSKPKTPPPQVVPALPPTPVIKTERSIFSPEKSTPPAPPLQVSPRHRPDLLVPKEEPAPFLAPELIRQEDKTDLSHLPNLHDLPSHLPSLAPPSHSPEETTPKEQKKKKKKHKEKHKEHKDKHKEHKDKHKNKHKPREMDPIVITIPKEKLVLPDTPPEQGLKIKIARDKIAPPTISPAGPTGLKIKISQGKITESKKRDRSEDGSPTLPSKYHRANGTTLQVGSDQSGRR